MDLERKIAVGKRETVAERLERHPALKARMERMLDVVENASGDVRRADEAERRAIEELRQMGLEVIEELRQMGLEVMQDWGRKTANEAAVGLEAKGGVVREVKKTALDLHVRRRDGGRADLPDKGRRQIVPALSEPGGHFLPGILHTAAEGHHRFGC